MERNTSAKRSKRERKKERNIYEQYSVKEEIIELPLFSFGFQCDSNFECTHLNLNLINCCKICVYAHLLIAPHEK